MTYTNNDTATDAEKNATQSGKNRFDHFDLSPVILKSLRAMGYSEPTPIQKEAIPLILDGHDLMGLAQTGTGKTAAFGLPLVEQLMGLGSKPLPKTVRALILSPTRELANQISENLKMFVRNTHLRVTTVVGGQSINVQQKQLGRGADVLVATPGRLLDLVERNAVYLDTARFLVLDEADQMLDLGFIHALRKISKLVAKERQTLLFSATMPKEISELAKAFLNDPVRIEVAPPGKAADKVSQCVHFVGQREKTELLKTLLSKRPEDLSLVFARTKHGAERLKKQLEAAGFAAGSIHGNKSQGQRDRAIREFKSGEMRILVATDVAARGIDISGVSHVYNFDLPEVPANYVHRIGRTARAGASGEAVAFCSPEEAHLLSAIEKTMGLKIPVIGEALSDEERREGALVAKEIRRGRGRGGVGPRRETRGTSARQQKGRKQRKPDNAPAKNTKSEVQSGAAESVDGGDDRSRVRAAGYTGKPNSKKNRKRFGNYGRAEGEKATSGANRHAPEARSEDNANSNSRPERKGNKFKKRDKGAKPGGDGSVAKYSQERSGQPTRQKRRKGKGFTGQRVDKKARGQG